MANLLWELAQALRWVGLYKLSTKAALWAVRLKKKGGEESEHKK